MYVVFGLAVFVLYMVYVCAVYAFGVITGFVSTRDTLIKVIFKNMALSMEVDILTFNKMLITYAASVAVNHKYIMIKTELDCPVVRNVRRSSSTVVANAS